MHKKFYSYDSDFNLHVYDISNRTLARTETDMSIRTRNQGGMKYQMIQIQA